MTLNDAAKYTKRGVVYFLIFVVLYITAETLIRGFLLVYGIAFPNPPQPPEIAYGKIKALNIRTLPIDLDSLNLRLEIPTDQIPNLPKSIYVYEIPPERTSVLKEERLKGVARELGFTETARNLSDSRRLWINNTNNTQFEAEVFYENFEYSTTAGYLEGLLTRGDAPSEEQALKATENFFTTTGVWTNEYRNYQYTYVPAYIEEGKIREALTPFRESIKFVSINPIKNAFTTFTPNEKGEQIPVENNIAILSKNPYISNIYTFVAGIAGNRGVLNTQVTDAKYIFYEPSNNRSYYPIMDINRAYQSLADGKASLVYIKKDGADYFAEDSSVNNIDTLDIRSIEIAYYLDTEYVQFIQPIYVFKGKFTTTDKQLGDVVFYLPAIDPQTTIN